MQKLGSSNLDCPATAKLQETLAETMKYLFILLTFFGVNTCFAQGDSTVIALLNNIIKREADTSIIGYTKTLGSEYYAYIERYAKKGKVYDRNSKKYVFSLSKKESELLRGQISTVRDHKWSTGLLPNAQLLIEGHSNEFFTTFPSREVYQFSVPVFIRNKTIALLLVKHHYPGNVKGKEEISFFQLVGNRWERIALLEESSWSYNSANIRFSKMAAMQ
jgi:hypothetical protein